jgi:quercetin dioxygenase-like cupin family protein
VFFFIADEFCVIQHKIYIMKRISLFLVTSCCVFFATQLQAQHNNFFKTDATMFKLLADTSFTSIAEVTFMPGQKSNTHTHSTQFVYALTDGALTVHYASGDVQQIELKAGDHFLAPADGPHWTENTGKKPVKFLLVEFNDYPYMEMKTSMKK